MSHVTDWTCRSCRAVLGQVRDGTLRPCVPVESIDTKGNARVPCPQRGRIQVWSPSTTRSAPESIRRTAVTPGWAVPRGG